MISDNSLFHFVSFNQNVGVVAIQLVYVHVIFNNYSTSARWV